VLNNGQVRKAKKPLTEQRKAITGNKVTASAQKEEDNTVVDIKRLAGLTKS
jgi:hypothetical protein